MASPAANFNTLDDVLYKMKISISIPQQSLEFAVQDLATEVNSSYVGLPFQFKIKIVGQDLQLDGITRNQQIRNLEILNKTVAEALTELVMKANPITTVQAPNESDQKLVWVVAQDADSPGTDQIVLISTRNAAKENGYQLPEPFQMK